jgi:two-component system NtrC family sensor kinase
VNDESSAALELSLKDLETISAVAAAVSGVLEPDQVLNRALDAVMEVSEAEKGLIHLLDAENQELVLRTQRGLSPGYLRAHSHLKLGEQVMGKTAASGEPSVIADSSTDALAMPEAVDTEEYRSLLCLPLLARGQTLGTIAVLSGEPRHFTLLDVQVLSAVAVHVATAVENARLFVQKERRVGELAALNEISQAISSTLELTWVLKVVAQKTAAICNAERCSILLLDRQNKELVPMMSQFASGATDAQLWRIFKNETLSERVDDVPVMKEVIREGKALVLDEDLESRLPKRWIEPFGIKSLLLVPLVSRDQTIGLLALDYATKAQQFTSAQVDLATTIGSQVAITIENARLYEQERKRATQLSVINEVGRCATSSLDLDELLQETAAAIRERFNYHFVSILMVNEEAEELEQRAEAARYAYMRTLGYRQSFNDGLLGWVARAGEPALVNDVAMDARYLEGFPARPFTKSELVVPIRLDSRVAAVLDIQSADLHAFDSADLLSVQAIADQLSVAMRNARLFQETKRSLNELSALHEMALAATSSLDLAEILDRIIGALERTLGFSNLSLMLIDEEEQRLKVRAGTGYDPQVTNSAQPGLGEGITGWVAQTGQPSNVPDVTADPRYIVADENVRSELCVPLKTGDRIIGVLNVESVEPAAFTDDDVRFLSTLAGQLAVTIENARLFQQVARSEKDWENTFQAITDGIAIYDAEFRIVRANPALADILETTPEGCIGKRCYEIFPHCQGPTRTSCPHRSTMETGGSRSIEVDVPDLGKTLHITSFPIHDEGGNVKGAVHNIRDITQQKVLRSQLLQTEKLAAIGQLISGVAHELNNPLTSVMGYAQLLQAADVSDEVRDDLRRIYQEAQRSARIISSLLTFARKETVEKLYTDVNQVLIDTINLRAYQLKVDNIELVTELDEHLPWTMVAPHQLQQVFLNLINNAHQAMLDCRGGGRLVVRSETDGDVIRVKVLDNGPGIPEDTLGKIFDPFFTTKEVGRGTGLGLSIAFGIVRDHGGHIWAESEVGSGTTFTVELPILEHSVDAPAHPQPAEIMGSHSGNRILVVDDEEEILGLVTRVLQQMGHETATAPTAEAALDALAKQEYDMIICDVRMPGMGGQQLYQLLRKENPALLKRLIFTTGDTISNSTRAFLQNVETPHVSKPFTIGDLQRAIEQVLRPH